MNQRSLILGLAAGVITFLTAANLCWSADWFGRFHDDSIYLSSAKALADGQGYVMPSVPGEPPQTKYPPLITFLTAANLCWSADWFGRFHDDSIYLSSAKALADGQGYVMPSVPGELPVVVVAGLAHLAQLPAKSGSGVLDQRPGRGGVFLGLLLRTEATRYRPGARAGAGRGLRLPPHHFASGDNLAE